MAPIRGTRRAARLLASAVALVAGVLVVLPAAPAAAENVVVVTSTDDSLGPGTLRWAFEQANTDGADTTIHVPTGTYVLDVCGGLPSGNEDGDLVHLADEALTIDGTGPGVVIEQTCANERVLASFGAGPVVLSDLTVTGGDLLPPNPPFDPGLRLPAEGGGVRASGDLTLIRVTVTGNAATGVSGTGGSVELDGTAAEGGGVWTAGSATLVDSDLSGNTATGGASGLYSLDAPFVGPLLYGGPARGGGLFAAGGLALTASTVSGNTAAGGRGADEFVTGVPLPGGSATGGGVYVGGSLDVTGSQLTSNIALGGPGFGPAAGGAAWVGLDADIEATTVDANGAVGHSPAGDAPAVGCPLRDDIVAAEGGGLAVEGDLDLTGVALVGNSASVPLGPWTAPAHAGCAGVLPGLDAVGGGASAGGKILVDGDSWIASNGAWAGAGGDLTPADAAAPPYDGGSARGGGLAGRLGEPASAGPSVFNTTMELNGAHGGDAGSDGIGVATGGSARGGAVSGEWVDVALSTLWKNGTVSGAGTEVGSSDGGTLHATTFAFLVNLTIEGGSALGPVDPGGAAAVSAATDIHLDHATVAPGSGSTTLAGDLEATASVVLPPATGVVCDGGGSSGGYNHFGDASCALGGVGDVEDGSDPGLLPLGEYGGPTRTRPPTPSSPLVDVVPAEACTQPIDQRGIDRPQGIGCDVGAVEIRSGSAFEGVEGFRLLDSRQVGAAPWDGSPVGAGEWRTLPVAGVGGIPADVSAVVASVTVTEPSAASYVAVRPSGAGDPDTANVVFAPGQTVTNLVTVGVGDGGAVDVFNQLGSTHVVVDVVGYYRRMEVGSGFAGMDPVRALDSRVAGAAPWDGSPLGAGATRALSVAGQFGVPGSATGVVANVTVTGGTAGSFLAVTPEGASAGTANLLFAAGETRSALVVVPLATPSIEITNQLGSVHVVVDVVGYFDPSAPGRFHAIDPDRLLDSRTALGFAGPIAGGTAGTVDVTHTATVPAGATAVVGNLTATQGTAATYLALGPAPLGLPASTASVLVGAGETVANAAYVGVGAGHGVDVFNQVGEVHAVLDAAGYFAPDT